MTLHVDVSRVAMQMSRGVVVASIQVDLDEAVLARFREDLLSRIQENRSRAVILDVSGLETLDSEELASLRRIITMTDLMGAQSVLAGLRPGVVSSLIETGADVDGLRVAIDLDAAFDLLPPELKLELDLDDESEDDSGADEQDPPEGAALPKHDETLADGR
jgi:rsbT antagonist protein RsbS